MLTDFQQFRNCVEHAGLAAHDCGKGHWQIKGGAYLVNCWPTTKIGFRFHVAGTVGARGGSVTSAIKAALNGRAGTGHAERKTRGNYYRNVRRSELVKDPHCWICHCDLTFETATIDHVIPLDKGGSNSRDNLRIACKTCNLDKANRIIVNRCRT